MMKLVLALLTASLVPGFSTESGGELRFSLHGDPKTFDPLLVDDESSHAVQYLTSGVLIRRNRRTQNLEPELALSWKVSPDSRRISLRLRRGVRFSDGTPFSAADVSYTFQRMMDPALHSPIGDSFRSGGGKLTFDVRNDYEITVGFPERVSALEQLLDQVPLLSAKSPRKEKAVLGPFQLSEHKPGAYLRLSRNPHYWKHDAQGRRLPYLDSVHLTIQQNRETELLRFRRGEIDLVNSIDAKLFTQLAAEQSSAARDLGPSLDAEFLWFNLSPDAPIPAGKKAWFQSSRFRRAISAAIRRDDLCRLAYLNRAKPGVGPVSPANAFWFNRNLKAHPFDLGAAKKLLSEDGFRQEGKTLRDREGNAVEFSVITNAGNQTRARMASLIQQDLAELGIRLNIVTLDFPSLLERISRTMDYELCLLGFVNIDLDPNAQMNVWLSSASNHPWNPRQKQPATAWEAEIDRLMMAQSAQADPQKRKALFDQVQRIVWEQAPIIYLVHKSHLAAVSPRLSGVDPGVLAPQTFWNAEWISLQPGIAKSR